LNELSCRRGPAAKKLATCEIYFDRNPDLAFEALERAGVLPPVEPEFCYRMTVARYLPGIARNVSLHSQDIENPQVGRFFTAILNEPKVPMWQVDRQ
jgi:hypothetical protein